MVLDFSLLSPWKDMRRCNLSDAGAVLAYFGDAGFKDDGSNGQVMVEIPKFWYKMVPGVTGYQWYISPYPTPGYKIHPAFVWDGVTKSKIYVGAYKACAYDVSESAYCLDDSLVADVAAGTGDKLSSIAGAKPVSGLNTALTLPNARTLAKNRGTGWGLVDFLSHSMIQMLMLVELGHFNAQLMIGNGITGITDDGSTNRAMPTGQTAGLGNQSGAATGNVHYATGQPANDISYRGLEGWWGNIWEWMDGINIVNLDQGPNPEAWVADHGYVSDKYGDPYSKVCTLPSVNGYISDIAPTAEHDYHFLPSAVAGSATTKLCDYYYQPGTSIYRAARRSGTWTGGSYAGPGVLTLGSTASFQHRSNGARLMFVEGLL